MPSLLQQNSDEHIYIYAASHVSARRQRQHTGTRVRKSDLEAVCDVFCFSGGGADAQVFAVRSGH